uniref:Uncharacterized protein n=1 Tax=Arundo donax TaxID=35708 RepID=A0A0A9GZL3_ARUDO
MMHMQCPPIPKSDTISILINCNCQKGLRKGFCKFTRLNWPRNK